MKPHRSLELAERAKAHISHTHGSHPSMVEHPEATVAAIVAAISATQTRSFTHFHTRYLR